MEDASEMSNVISLDYEVIEEAFPTVIIISSLEERGGGVMGRRRRGINEGRKC